MSAEGFSWVGNTEPTANVVPDRASPHTNDGESYAWGSKDCVSQYVKIDGASGGGAQICVFQGDGFRYGLLNRWVQEGLTGFVEEAFLIGFPSDQRMYKVSGMSSRFIVHVPHSKHIIIKYPLTFTRILSIVKNIKSKLLRVVASNGDVSYRLLDDSVEPLLKNQNNENVGMDAIAASSNGKWLAIDTREAGLVRMNMETFEIKWFSKFKPVSYGSVEFAISDDGKYVAAVGYNSGQFISEISAACGLNSYIFPSERYSNVDLLTHPCPERSIGNVINAINPAAYMVNFPKFSSDGGELTVYTEPSRPENAWLTISAGGYVAPKVEYLAMGDSYSSGEGDTIPDSVTRQKHYLAYTNVDGDSTTLREKCHISTRSYPFLLKQRLNLNDASMKSVACSGAEVKRDYSFSENYRGQPLDEDTDRLEGLTPSVLAELKYQALSKFIPGRVQQVQFVEKYQPKVITLTGGGNDAQFGKIVKSCVSSTSVSCDYAWTSDGLAMVGYGIMTQYTVLRDFYKELQRASSNTRIYVVGYPQFVSDTYTICPLKNVKLDKSERAMIRNAVSYMNDIIEAAAKSAGVHYVDIEKSLEPDGLLCTNGTQLVNGLTAVLDCTFGIKVMYLGELYNDECQEGFHPNHLGHKAIEDAIFRSTGNILTSNFCPPPYAPSAVTCGSVQTMPSPPPIFLDAINSVIRRSQPGSFNADKYVQKNNNMKLDIKSETYQFKPNSDVRIEVHSDPIVLGEYTTDSEGTLITSATVPDTLDAGYHSVHLIGETFSGEAIDIWEIIMVYGKAGDVDEDGVSDSTDPCLFTSASGADEDSDGNDDGCDPYVGNSIKANEIINEDNSNIEVSGGRVKSKDNARNVLNNAENSNMDGRTQVNVIYSSIDKISSLVIGKNAMHIVIYGVLFIFIVIICIYVVRLRHK